MFLPFWVQRVNPTQNYRNLNSDNEKIHIINYNKKNRGAFEVLSTAINDYLITKVLIKTYT